MAKARKLKLVHLPPVLSPQCRRAGIILTCGHGSAQAVLDAFELCRRERGSRRGMTTDPEQDLLRAMLVVAAAGVDAMMKQLVRDSLPSLVSADVRVREGLQKFVAERVRGDGDVGGSGKFLARVLAAPSHQTQVIDEYVNDLTGSSLQSPDELFRVSDALGVDPKSLGVDFRQLRSVFDIRNKIIHELDINLEADRRKRNLRKTKDMIRHVDLLLSLAQALCGKVSEKLAAAGPPPVKPVANFPFLNDLG